MRQNLSVALFVSLSLAPRGARGDIPQREKQFIQVLVNEYGVLGIAEAYCRKRLKEVASDSIAVASLRYFVEADIPRMRGDLDAFEKACRQLAKEFPEHPRAGRSRLDVLKAQIDRLTRKWEEAQLEPDQAKRKALTDQIVKTFQGQGAPGIRQGFLSLIKDLNEAVKNAERDEFGFIKDVDLALLRNESELFWILALTRFARFIKGEEYKELREKIYTEALEASERFVEDRPTFFVLRFLAQIQKGLCYAKLGKLDDAVDAFEALFTIVPPVAPSKWDQPLVVKICEIRLQAYLYAMRACNEAGDFRRAARISDRLFAGQRPPFNLVDRGPKEPTCRPYWVEAQLEAGVARAGVGRPLEGAKLIQNVISTYEMLTAQKGAEEARSYVQKARAALARMVTVAGPIFPHETIIEAGKGYKAQLNWEAARGVFQMGLCSLSGGQETVKYGPVYLKEIAECSHLAGETRAALFAALAAYRHFVETAPAELRERLANYALAAADAIRDRETNVAFQRYYEEAAQFFMLYGKAGFRETQKISQGIDLKNKGLFDQAREKFLSVKKEYQTKDETKPYESYWRSRAEAAHCLYLKYKKALTEKKADPAQAQKLREQAHSELTTVLTEALKGDVPQLDGAAAAVLYLSDMYLEEGKEDLDKALEVLALYESDLKETKEYGDQILANWAIALARAGKKEEAAEKFKELRARFPDSIEWARVGYDLFYLYYGLQEACAAAAYARAYLSHPRVQAMEEDLDTLFAVGQTFADCGKKEYLPRAKEIFQKFVDAPDRDRRITARQGLVKILIAQGRYTEAVMQGEALLKEKKQGDQWVPPLYYDLKRAYVGVAIQALKNNEKAKAVKALAQAEEKMGHLVNLVDSAREDALNAGERSRYRRITVVYYRYWAELLDIYWVQRRYDRIVRYATSLLQKRPPFLPEELVARLAARLKAAKKRLER